MIDKKEVEKLIEERFQVIEKRQKNIGWWHLGLYMGFIFLILMMFINIEAKYASQNELQEVKSLVQVISSIVLSAPKP
jgi:hypothetical protein